MDNYLCEYEIYVFFTCKCSYKSFVVVVVM